MHKIIKMVSPTVCRVCKRDWANGACGDCTLTRQQLEASEKLERCVRDHLEAYDLLNNNDDPAKNDVFLANILQTYRDMRDALLDSAE